jgi:hypothetical protein
MSIQGIVFVIGVEFLNIVGINFSVENKSYNLKELPSNYYDVIPIKIKSNLTILNKTS